MTWRDTMTGRETMTAAARAARDQAGPPARGWRPVLLRVAGAGLLIATGAIHLDLYLTGYRSIPAIGWLFLLQVIAAFGLALAALAIPGRLAAASRLAAAAGAGFALATLGGYLLSVWIGLFGFTEVRTTAGIAAGIVEVAAFAVLAALTLAPAPAAGPAKAPARFPAQIPPALTRAAGATAAGVALAALVLLGLAVAGAGAAAPAATGTGTGLTTTTIRGTTVLANAKGFTLYSFAPDTPAASKCYGSCAAYWPPVTGTAAASPGLPGTAGTIQRTDGPAQLTYNGHPLYTYIGDTAPGQARGNNLNLYGGLWHEIRVSEGNGTHATHDAAALTPAHSVLA
jgi:predicted lipoprotein with Yx(FWY)xxD motif